MTAAVTPAGADEPGAAPVPEPGNHADGPPRPAELDALVVEVSGATQRVRWSSERLRDEYCRRSPRQLLDDGSIGFTCPCVDLSGLLAWRAADAGLAPRLVLTRIARPGRQVKFQGLVELDLGPHTWVVGFSETAVRVHAGSVPVTRHRTDVLRRPFDGASRGEQSFLEHFVSAGVDGLGDLVKSYDLEADLAWHCRRQSAWRFHWLRLRSGRKRGPAIHSATPSWAATARAVTRRPLRDVAAPDGSDREAP